MAVSKRIVAVSWTLPPIVLPRSIQISRLLVALERRGWSSTVLTAPVDSNDPTIPRDRILAAHYEGRYKQIEVEYREARAPSPFTKRLYRLLHGVKDVDDANWVERVSLAALRELASREDVFISFAQPWIDHAVGLKVKRSRPEQPWIAHFSDPWVDSLYYDAKDPSQAARLAIWREQERVVVERADAVIFVTTETADLVMRKYPAGWQDKVHIVPHSFDRSLVDRVARSPAEGRGGRALRIVYTGNIYAGRREPLPLFEALAALDRSGALRGRIELSFHGHIPSTTIARAKELGLSRFVTFHGPVTYIQSLALMTEADALLLVDATAEVNVFLPSKIADYLMTNKPIIGLTPPRGATADVLRRIGHLSVDPADRAGIEAALMRLIETHEAGAGLSPINADAVRVFEVNQVAEKFEGVLNAARERAQS